MLPVAVAPFVVSLDPQHTLIWDISSLCHVISSHSSAVQSPLKCFSSKLNKRLEVVVSRLKTIDLFYTMSFFAFDDLLQVLVPIYVLCKSSNKSN